MLTVRAAAAAWPDRPFIVDRQGTLTFAAAYALLPTVPAAVGVVALEVQPTRADLLRLAALIDAGVPFLPMHPRLTAAERAAILADADALWWPRGDDLPAAVRVTGRLDPEAPLAIVPTSGSSGRPRGVVLSRRAFAAAAVASRANLGVQTNDRWLLALPPAHVGGLSILTRALHDGTAIVPWGDRPFAVEPLLACVETFAVTLLSLVPTMLHRVLATDAVCPARLRAILLGGAPAPAALLAAAAARRWPVLTTYGLTEACSQVATTSPGVTPRRELGVGRPLSGTAVRIVDGRIHLRGPTLFSGYHPPGVAPFDADGWFDTGDLGHLDATGALHVDGRQADLVIVGGENVSPVEVETAALSVPGIAEACVFGVPDPEWGERLALVVAPEATGGPDDAILLAALRERLARFKCPTLIARAETLPRRSIDKLDRRSVAAYFTPLLRPLRAPRQ